jgi:hypothetical protein
MEPLFQYIQEHKKATKNPVKCQVVCALNAAGLRDPVLIYTKKKQFTIHNSMMTEYLLNTKQMLHSLQ